MRAGDEHMQSTWDQVMGTWEQMRGTWHTNLENPLSEVAT